MSHIWPAILNLLLSYCWRQKTHYRNSEEEWDQWGRGVWCLWWNLFGLFAYEVKTILTLCWAAVHGHRPALFSSDLKKDRNLKDSSGVKGHLNRYLYKCWFVFVLIVGRCRAHRTFVWRSGGSHYRIHFWRRVSVKNIYFNMFTFFDLRFKQRQFIAYMWTYSFQQTLSQLLCCLQSNWVWVAKNKWREMSFGARESDI